MRTTAFLAGVTVGIVAGYTASILLVSWLGLQAEINRRRFP